MISSSVAIMGATATLPAPTRMTTNSSSPVINRAALAYVYFDPAITRARVPRLQCRSR
jgi:hypothetical protein